jgi:O-antigen ligase
MSLGSTATMALILSTSYFPLLLAEFEKSPRAGRALVAFIASAAILLLASWVLALGRFPLLPDKTFGVLVKDRITQGTVFTLAMAFLLELGAAALKRKKRSEGAASFALAGAFFVNIFFVTLSRTALVTVPILLIIFAIRHLRWREMIIFLPSLAAIGALVWIASPHVRDRITQIPEEIESFNVSLHDTSAGARVEFWKTSIAIMGDAPLFGHGTGSINAEFSRVAGQTSSATNPHNQIFAVGMQLGLVGVILLVAMWWWHGRLFMGWGIPHWVGLCVVVENVIGSMFNSSLFDFTPGWIYVFGVGIAGGRRTSRYEHTAAAAGSTSLLCARHC